jgi:putative hemolysin
VDDIHDNMFAVLHVLFSKTHSLDVPSRVSSAVESPIKNTAAEMYEFIRERGGNLAIIRQLGCNRRPSCTSECGNAITNRSSNNTPS